MQPFAAIFSQELKVLEESCVANDSSQAILDNLAWLNEVCDKSIRNVYYEPFVIYLNLINSFAVMARSSQSLATELSQGQEAFQVFVAVRQKAIKILALVRFLTETLSQLPKSSDVPQIKAAIDYKRQVLYAWMQGIRGRIDDCRQKDDFFVQIHGEYGFHA